MEMTTLGSEQLKFLLVLLGLLAMATTGAVLHMRQEWRALRHKLFRLQDGLAKSARPGRVAERLASGRWDAAFRESLETARRDSAAQGGNIGAAFDFVASAEESLRPIVDSVAPEAMRCGDPRSALVRLEQVVVYLLVFPGRHEDRRTFRRCEAFSEGWPSHAAAVRRASSEGGSAPPMVALLYFLGLDAHDGALLVAYEADDERRYPAELADVSGGPAVARGGTNLTYEFALA